MLDSVAASPSFLLGYFADFYEEVASIKLAFAQGRMPLAIVAAGEVPPAPAELATRVAAHLETMLRSQARDVRRQATAPEIKMFDLAQYLMAALADEIFILELDWPGRATWLGMLLEYRLFRSRNAGMKFFELADQLLHIHQRSPLLQDTASVFLLAMQLGFKGRYRGANGEATLRDYRQRLYRLSDANHHTDNDKPAFEQAYQHRLSGAKDERLAPLSRWKVAGQISLAAYLAASTIVWAVSLYPFEQAFGG